VSAPAERSTCTDGGAHLTLVSHSDAVTAVIDQTIAYVH
jgi:hypothetical protein